MKLKSAFLLGVIVSVTGCTSNDMSDLRAYVEEVKQRRPGRIEPLPEIKEVETYTYISSSERDPFTQAQSGETEKSEIKSNGLKPDFNRRKEELEGYPLDALRMVGTLKQGDSHWALVRNNTDGTIHTVKPGNYLGMNFGEITRISQNKIELRELIQDGQGGYIERQAVLALGEE